MGGQQAARVLVVEDDAAINDVVCTRLGREGYQVTAAFSGSEARLLLGQQSFDLVITDLMLPGATGEDIVAAVRAADPALPIIVTSARTAAADKVGLLGQGADDYLTKPFDLDELAARVAVQLRHRAQGHQGVAGARGASSVPGAASTVSGAGAPLRCGRWMVDQAARTLSVDGGAVPLTRTEYAIAELLASHPGRVFTKQELFEHAWGEPYAAQESTVSAHVSNLRAKLKPTGTDDYVATVWGIGFKLDVG